MEVEHNLFGRGKILHIEGSPPNRKARVYFSETGEEKQLLLKFARLKIISNS
jgi:DNA helicase-2/ATP-dependent DNA helicase PcrA